VKGAKQEGVRAGNWLTKEEAEQLINTPVTRWRQEDIPLRKAIRDQAILALMIGTGLGDDPAARRPLGDHRPGGQAWPGAHERRHAHRRVFNPAGDLQRG
jgi:hypothetical protein